MPLPSAVQKIGEAAEAAAVEAGLKAGQPGEEAPAAAAPAAEPVATIVPDPAKKVDPDDYKERFSRYKATTDTTISELRQTLASVQATLAEVQRQNQEMRTATTAPAAPTESPADREEAEYQAWLSQLPDSIKEEYTEDWLKDQFIIQRTAAPKTAVPENLKDLEQKVNKVAQFQEKTAAQLYEESMDGAYPGDAWITMTKNENWSDFCAKTVSPIDQRRWGDIVKGASDAHDSNTVIWVLKQFEQHLSTLNGQPADTPAANPLESQITPDGASGGGSPIDEAKAQAGVFTITEVNAFFKEAATGKTYTPEQKQDIEKQILAAQKAGNIIPG